MKKILSHTLNGAEGPKVFKNCKVYNLENKMRLCLLLNKIMRLYCNQTLPVFC